MKYIGHKNHCFWNIRIITRLTLLIVDSFSNLPEAYFYLMVDYPFASGIIS